MDDRAAMEAMAFRIEGEADKWRSRQERSYASGPAKIVGCRTASAWGSRLVRGARTFAGSRSADRKAASSCSIASLRMSYGSMACAPGAAGSFASPECWHNLLYVVPGR